MHLPFDARVMLLDGPVAVCIHEATESAILEAFARLGKLVAVAAKQLNKEPSCTVEATDLPTLES